MKLKEIDRELARLQRTADATQELLDADVALHRDKQNWAKQSTWGKQVNALRKRIGELEQQRQDVVVYGERPARQAAPPAKRKERKEYEKILAEVGGTMAGLMQPPERGEVLLYLDIVTEKIREIDGRLNALGNLEYRGVWSRDAEYKRGNFCTFNGAIWHCDVNNRGSAPGDGALWKLACKSGRDGRPGKDAK